MFRLYDALAPTRYVSGLFGIDRQARFAVVNTVLVLFGLWCWRARVSMVGYYLDSRLRAAPTEREKFCRPLR